MAPLQHLSPRKVLLLLLLVSAFLASICVSTSHGLPSHRNGRRRLLAVAQEEDDDEPVVIKKKTTSTSSLGSNSKPKNQTKLANPTISSSKNHTKLLIKTSTGIPSKNQTKLLVKTPNASSTKNQTKLLVKTPSQPAKNKTKSSLQDQPTIAKKQNSTTTKKPADVTKSPPPKKNTATATTPPKSKTPSTDKKPKRSWPSWVDQDDDDDDLVSEFRTLPSKFQEQLLPDLERISKTSQVYLNRANKEITRGFKPYVGNRYAPTIASFISFAFIIIPLILVSLIFSKIKTYFSLQRIIIFIQIYLSIYFSILCISAIVTGLEPLKFLYATSHSTYFCLQVLQTLAYVLYLLLLLMYLILVFSTETAIATKMLGLAQTLVGYAVGLHYYVTVFHKTVLHQPPKTSWKIHAIYAAAFLLICVLTRADRTKKPYSDGDESKLS